MPPTVASDLTTKILAASIPAVKKTIATTNPGEGWLAYVRTHRPERTKKRKFRKTDLPPLLEKSPAGKAAVARMNKIREKLLAAGGWQICLSPTDDDSEIVADGVFWMPENISFRSERGEPSNCHRNAADAWKRSRSKDKIAVGTGYALSKDGVWRPHSWLFRETKIGVAIYETTEPRIAYFGAILSKERVEKIDFHIRSF